MTSALAMYLPLAAAKGQVHAVFFGADVWANIIALGSLCVSAASYRVSRQAARHVKVWFESAEASNKTWLTAVVRNPGGAAVRINGWGVLASSHRLRGYKELKATGTGTAELDAPDKLPCDVPPGGSLRLSWEAADIAREYNGEPKRIRVFIRVSWKKRPIRSLWSGRWPQE
jgi:hypothetical protein